MSFAARPVIGYPGCESAKKTATEGRILDSDPCIAAFTPSSEEIPI
jgi:hypothetical protein